jgi:hypothetical protein
MKIILMYSVYSMEIKQSVRLQIRNVYFFIEFFTNIYFNGQLKLKTPQYTQIARKSNFLNSAQRYVDRGSRSVFTVQIRRCTLVLHPRISDSSPP